MNPRLQLLLIVVLLMLAGISLALDDRGEAEADRPHAERDVKAVYFYNFAKFVEWPAEAFEAESDPIRVAIVGRDPFGTTLDEVVEGRKAQGRELLIDRVEAGADLAGYHMAFLGLSDAETFEGTLAGLEGQPTVTVSDERKSIAEGVVIRFVRSRSAVRFELDISAAERCGVQLSSRLITLAARVIF